MVHVQAGRQRRRRAQGLPVERGRDWNSWTNRRGEGADGVIQFQLVLASHRDEQVEAEEQHIKADSHGLQTARHHLSVHLTLHDLE